MDASPKIVALDQAAAVTGLGQTAALGDSRAGVQNGRSPGKPKIYA